MYEADEIPAMGTEIETFHHGFAPFFFGFDLYNAAYQYFTT
jgi:hypothetical protein